MGSTVADEKRIRSFEDLIAEEGLLPLARTVDLVGQIAEAIAATHADGGAVDCLEPRAILVNEETDAAGRTVTTVLGIMRSSDLPVRPGGPRASYTAPEDQGAGGDRGFGELTHQFSLAAIAYEMLAGCPAFPEEIGETEPAGQGQGREEAGQGRGWSRPPPRR